MITVKALYRYPIKGFSAEPLDAVDLRPGEGIPGDRRLAVTNGKWDYVASEYEARKKTDFIALMTHPRVALLKTRLYETEHGLSLSVRAGTRGAAETFYLSTDAGRSEFINFLVGFLALEPVCVPRLIAGRQNLFTDLAPLASSLECSMSVANLATIRELEQAFGRKLDPLRFRANVYIDGAEPWEELSWMGSTLSIGQACIKAVMRTRRCAVTNVDPETGRRTHGVPQTLVRRFGHQNMGVYVDAIGVGQVRLGDEVRLKPNGGVQDRQPEVLLYGGVEFPLYR